MGFSTDCIHAGNEPDPTTGSVAVPIYQTSTYVQEGLGKHKGYEYGRTQNPTRSALEENLAVLEGGAGARAFASGMAAITAISTLVKAGDHVVCSNMTYGGTYRYYTKILANYGVDVLVRRHGRRRPTSSARSGPRRRCCTSSPRPTRRCSSATSRRSRSSRTGTAPSSSWTTPSPRRTSRSRSPSARTSSCTRRRSFSDGHSDTVGGAAIAKSKEHVEWLSFVQNSSGAILSPMDSWLVLRGIKTLSVRMERHEVNGRAVAEHLAKHPKVRKVNYPGPRRRTPSTRSRRSRCRGSAR